MNATRIIVLLIVLSFLSVVSCSDPETSKSGSTIFQNICISATYVGSKNANDFLSQTEIQQFKNEVVKVDSILRYWKDKMKE
jgi:hypothetical protein